MKKATGPLFLIGIITSYFLLLSAFRPAETTIEDLKVPHSKNPKEELEKKVFEILQAKCNVCHRKQNPFKIFSLKNMNKQAPKIHQQVFVKKRMPKGDKIRLTEEEYQILKNWLHSQNIK